MKKLKKAAITATATMAAAVTAGLAYPGWKYGWGPFKGLFRGFESEVKAIEDKYDSETRKNEIVFYGASNFRLWKEMENDLPEYRVQNHGFGGSTDKDLYEYAERILYPYEPDIVFFQTGSNDYVQLTGSDEIRIQVCVEFKKQMFEEFHRKLPDARFVVMSGLLLPGRSQYTDLTIKINRQLKKLCDEHSDYMTFIDAEKMTFDGQNYAEELFIKDGIHLNHEGQLKWCNEYIRPVLEKLTESR